MNSAHSFTEGMDYKEPNILFNDRVRKKAKSFRHYFLFNDYYEDESISLKEKAYTFMYNLQKKGYTTQGEMDWSLRMMKMNYDGWKRLENQFDRDYKEYLGFV